MSTTVDELFITKWESELSMAFQRTESLLRSTVKNYHGVGEKFSFPRMRTVGVQRNKARHADLVPSDASEDRREAVISTVHSSVLIDDLDLVRTNVDLRTAYSKAIVAAVNRDIDDIILEELANTTNEVTLPTSGVLDGDGLAKISEALTDLDVPFGDRTIVVSPSGMTDMLLDTTLVSNDFVRKGAYESGVIKGVFGFNVIQHTGLGDGSDSGHKQVFAYHRDAVGLAIAKDVTMKVGWVDMKDAWLVTAKCAVGAKIIEDEGVVWADVAI